MAGPIHRSLERESSSEREGKDKGSAVAKGEVRRGLRGPVRSQGKRMLRSRRHAEGTLSRCKRRKGLFHSDLQRVEGIARLDEFVE